MLPAVTRGRVIFLGTGGAINAERYQASMVVEAGETRVLLDTGGGLGLVRRLHAAAIPPPTVGHVVLSHRHLDHVGGLEPLLLTLAIPTRRTGQPAPALRLYASPETAAAVRATLAAADAAGASFFGGALAWVTPAPGEPVAAGPDVRLALVPVDHLPEGGGASGCVLDLGGVRVAYSGDTRPCAALAEAARGVDLLIHEVGGLDREAAVVHRPGHSTAGEAGRVARAAGARALALVHLPPSWASDPAALLAEARAAAPDVDVFVAEDGMARAL
jgi:ribonuclease BN (tRNA processing enzyme)